MLARQRLHRYIEVSRALRRPQRSREQLLQQLHKLVGDSRRSYTSLSPYNHKFSNHCLLDRFSQCVSRSGQRDGRSTQELLLNPKRFFSYSRGAMLRRAERNANSHPEDAFAQAEYMKLLNMNNMPDEVIRRFESGKFGSNPAAAEEYVNALVDVGVIRPGERQQFLENTLARQRSAEFGGSHLGSTRNNTGSWAYNSPFGGSAVSSPGSPFYFGDGSGHGAGGGGGSGYGGYSAGSDANPVVVRLANKNSRLEAVMNLLRLGVSVAFVILLYRMMTSGPGGRSPLDTFTGGSEEDLSEIPDTRFEDVKGIDEVKEELQDVVKFLKDSAKYQRLGARVPRGVLLTGPPGTGKTLLARAVAGEAGVAFYNKSASEFEEVFVGLGSKRIRDLFKHAKENAPSIIFIDEVDAVGGRRESKGMGAMSSQRQTLNQLLACMDGFEKNDEVIVIAATNSPDMLDSALTRPGRFDTKISVGLPDVRGRKEILELYLSRIIPAEDVDAELLAYATPGFTGADLSTMVNQAALIAANRGAAKVERVDMEEARDKIIMGPARKHKVQRKEVLEMTAYHEGGHTLAALLTPEAEELHKVTILPRGVSGGATFFLNTKSDEGYKTRQQILAEIDVAMGGRVAEELIYGKTKVTTGAGSDMRSASNLARNYCKYYSMSDLGLSSYADEKPSANVQAAIDAEVERLLQESYHRVYSLVSSNRHKLDRLARALLGYETLTAAQVRHVINKATLPQYEELARVEEEDKRRREEEAREEARQRLSSVDRQRRKDEKKKTKEGEDSSGGSKQGFLGGLFGGGKKENDKDSNDEKDGEPNPAPQPQAQPQGEAPVGEKPTSSGRPGPNKPRWM